MVLLAKRRGFILLELLLACAVFIGAAGALFLQGRALLRQYYKQQVRLTAQLLAADLRQLQQRTLYRGSGAIRKLQVSSSNLSSYSFFDGWLEAARVDFSKLGCGDVYFSKSIAAVSFSTSGAPASNGEYWLRHRKLPDFYCRLVVQPVTGRVLIYEGE